MSNRTGVPEGLHAPLNKPKHSVLLPTDAYQWSPQLKIRSWRSLKARLGKRD
jgi:hypothetical protein